MYLEKIKSIQNNYYVFKENSKPSTEEKVCMNCKHMLWLVGIGQGVKCRARDMYAIPNRWYSCEKFEYREEPKKKGE